MPRPKKKLKPEDYVAVAAMAARGLRKEDVARRLNMAGRTLDSGAAADMQRRSVESRRRNKREKNKKGR